MGIGMFARRNLFHARVLAKLTNHLDNAWEVWRAFRAGRPATRLTLRGGPTIHARPEDEAFNIFWEIFVDRCYFPPGAYAPRPGDTIVDVGANIGIFDLHCQTLAPGVRIHAVEPDPETYARLRRNVEANGLESSVSTYNLAVSDRRGTLHLATGFASGHQHLRDAGAGAPVACITLDDLFERAEIETCDLLKVDTEGAEFAIIEGASRDLWARIRNVALEHHDAPASGERLASYLAGLGFRCSLAPVKGYPHLGMLHATKG